MDKNEPEQNKDEGQNSVFVLKSGKNAVKISSHILPEKEVTRSSLLTIEYEDVSDTEMETIVTNDEIEQAVETIKEMCEAHMSKELAKILQDLRDFFETGKIDEKSEINPQTTHDISESEDEWVVWDLSDSESEVDWTVWNVDRLNE
jgi:Ran GTPase-activating protein (RanGAP) involved in mRNA processing and transport